ncbi:hypothetical protein N7486_007619 [Penicillium sp. IBT 16267x]|nr:hypothetical protein N7486_007619 [Penicillium sp. IBT 16267x]
MTQSDHASAWEKDMEIDFNAQEAFAPQRDFELESFVSLQRFLASKRPNVPRKRREPSFFDRKKDTRTKAQKVQDHTMNSIYIRDKIRARNMRIAEDMPLPLTLGQLFRLPARTRLRLQDEWEDGDICPEGVQNVFQLELKRHKERMRAIRLDKKMARALDNLNIGPQGEPTQRGNVAEMESALGGMSLTSPDETME